MNRRDAVLAMLVLGAVPGMVFAQASTRIYRVAVVFNGSTDADRVSLDALKQGLKALGIKIPQSVLLRADRVIE